MLVDVIWPNAPALVGTPAGLAFTVQAAMAEFGREKFVVLVRLCASARKDNLYFSVNMKSLKTEKSRPLHCGP